MISDLLVLVLGDILAQPRKFSGLAFVIVLCLELVFLVLLPQRKLGLCVRWISRPAACLWSFSGKNGLFGFPAGFGFVGLRCCHAVVVFKRG